MYYPGETLDESINGTVKIALIGSDSYEPGGMYDWQGKFAEGLAKLADPIGGQGLLMYKNLNYTILNCKPANPPHNPTMDINNPEMVTKVSASFDFCSVADAIFCHPMRRLRRWLRSSYNCRIPETITICNYNLYSMDKNLIGVHNAQ